MNTAEVIDGAVENHSRELGSAVHQIKTVLRKRHPHIDPHNGLVASLREFWADLAQRDAVLTPTVLQSASHLLCIRLGLQRHEEFAAMWLVKTERNRLARRNPDTTRLRQPAGAQQVRASRGVTSSSVVDED